jgi:hypothetical protein
MMRTGLLSPADLWLFASSALGLLLLPAAPRRLAGGLVAAFAGLGLFLLAEPELPAALQPSHSVAVWFLLTLVPLLLLIPDLMARGRVAQVINLIPLRSLIALSLVHVMGLRHVFSALEGDLEAGRALGFVSGEFFSALGGAVLWIWFRPDSRWFRIAALFWNVHALVPTLEFAVRLLAAHPGMPVFAAPAPGLFGFFSTWPGSLEALFWTPLLLCLHAALFYKLLVPRPDFSGRAFTPGNPT